MELITALRLFQKWFWLLILGAVLVSGVAYAVYRQQPSEYQATVIIAVGTTLDNPNPDSSLISTGEDLARTYARLAKTHEVLDAAIAVGGFPVKTHELRDMVSAHPIPDTPLIEIEVIYTDPVLAADIANEVARQLINNSPSFLTDEQQSQLDIATNEIRILSQELIQFRAEIAALDETLRSATDPDELRLLREQRLTLTTIVDDKSSTIAEFTKVVAEFQQRTNSLTVVESALPDSDPIGFGPVLTGLAGGLLGLAAASIIALLIEYFDDSIPTATQAARLLQLPVYATIVRFGRRRDNYRKRLIAYSQPDAVATEGYRSLRTNLLYTSNGTERHLAFIITSASKGEGKSVTAVNLAITIALTGLRVLLVDADLRNPTVHRFFDLKNTKGLSNLGSVPIENGPSAPDFSSKMRQIFNDTVQETEITGLRVLTSGPMLLHPAELLGSETMRQWVSYLQSLPDVDVVIFDTPPLLAVADSSTLSMSSNIPIILVIHAQRTRSGAVIMTKERLDILGMQVTGVVLNSISPKLASTYYR